MAAFRRRFLTYIDYYFCYNFRPNHEQFFRTFWGHNVRVNPVDAYNRFLAEDLVTKEKPSTDEREALQIGCLYFVETLLNTGDAQKALNAMADNLESPWPIKPQTTGKQILPGMVNLDFKPYTTRRYIDMVTSILILRVQTDGERRVLPWLFQTLKYAFTAERRIPLCYLLQLALTPEESSEALSDFVVSLLAQSTRPPEDISLHLAELVTNTSDPQWTWQLACTLAVQTEKDLEPLTSRLMINFYWTEGPPKAIQINVTLSEIVGLLTSNTHPAVCQVVCAYLMKTGQPVAPYQDAIIARFTDSDSGYLNMAAKHLSEGRCRLTGEQLRIVKQVTKTEAVAALLANAAAAESLIQVENSNGWQKSSGYIEALYESAGSYFAFYKTILHTVPNSEWRTDEDTFGALVIDAQGFVCCPIPEHFLSRPTGAAGARRHLSPLTIIGDDGEVLAKVCEPFMEQDGQWGDRNYL